MAGAANKTTDTRPISPVNQPEHAVNNPSPIQPESVQAVDVHVIPETNGTTGETPPPPSNNVTSQLAEPSSTQAQDSASNNQNQQAGPAAANDPNALPAQPALLELAAVPDLPQAVHPDIWALLNDDVALPILPAPVHPDILALLNDDAALPVLPETMHPDVFALLNDAGENTIITEQPEPPLDDPALLFANNLIPLMAVTQEQEPDPVDLLLEEVAGPASPLSMQELISTGFTLPPTLLEAIAAPETSDGHSPVDELSFQITMLERKIERLKNTDSPILALLIQKKTLLEDVKAKKEGVKQAEENRQAHNRDITDAKDAMAEYQAEWDTAWNDITWWELLSNHDGKRSEYLSIRSTSKESIKRQKESIQQSKDEIKKEHKQIKSLNRELKKIEKQLKKLNAKIENQTAAQSGETARPSLWQNFAVALSDRPRQNPRLSLQGLF